jgi:alpha-tubulin suppressor-like RCC1 family protein
LLALLALGAACDFGVDLSGLSDGSVADVSSDASVDVTLDVPTPSVPVTMMALGSNMSCAMRVDGSVLCWGNGSNGRLGNGATFDSSVPVPVSGVTDAVWIGGGAGHMCAVRKTGDVLCWGYNSFGQIGDGTTNEHTTPFAVGLTDATQVAGIMDATCALHASGQVSCWGNNADGQIGDGTTTKRASPTLVMGLDDAVAIRGAAAGGHFCALRQAGGVVCWGNNSNGQIGNGTTTNVSMPTAPSGLGVATAITTGANHTCAVVGGNVWCFGANSSGQLGNTQISDSNKPTQTSVITGAVDLSAGSIFTCASTATNVQCWGGGAGGQLGLGAGNTPPQSTIPVVTASVALPVQQMASGAAHTCAVVDKGAVMCWGFNGNGRIGIGTALTSNVPVPVVSLTSATELAVGSDHTCANAEAGTVCWGDNGYGQVGTVNSALLATSTPLASLQQGLTGLIAGASHTCGIASNGDVFCFGYDSNGQLGNGSTANSASGVRMGAGVGLTAVALAAGTAHTCSLADSGVVSCVGYNAYGQLGNGTTSTSTIPVNVVDADGGLTGVKGIAAGYDESCAATPTKVYCWGLNVNGQTGDGTTATPVTVATPAIVLDAGIPISFAIGSDHACAVLSNHDVECWGAGGDGQLGDGNSSQQALTPVQATTNAIQVAAGANHSCALHGDGKVDCWGYGLLGEIGNGQNANQPSPTPVTGITTAVAIRASGDTTCVLLQDGTVQCWGYNPDGQLGNGSVVVVPGPTFVVGL